MEPGEKGCERVRGARTDVDVFERAVAIERSIDRARPLDDEGALDAAGARVAQQLAQTTDVRVPRTELRAHRGTGPPGSGRVERVAGRGDEGAERSVVVHRGVGGDLAVDVDLGRLQAGDEARVRDVVLTARGVDAHDPEPAELALARAAVAVGVLPRVHDLLVGLADAAAARTAVSRGSVEDLAATLLA